MLQIDEAIDKIKNVQFLSLEYAPDFITDNSHNYFVPDLMIVQHPDAGIPQFQNESYTPQYNLAISNLRKGKCYKCNNLEETTIDDLQLLITEFHDLVKFHWFNYGNASQSKQKNIRYN